MIILLPKCHLQGDTCSPNKIEADTGIKLSMKNEVGDMGTMGRYRGTPIPYGSATLQPSENQITQNALRWLLETVKKNLAVFKENGASSITLDLVVLHDGQCNLEFTPDELRSLGELGLPLTLSTSECLEEVEKMRQP